MIVIFLFSSCASSTQLATGEEIVSMPRFTYCKDEPPNLIAQDKCARFEMGLYINKKLAEFNTQYNIGGFTDDFVITMKIKENGEMTDVEAHKGTDKDLNRVMVQIFKAMDNWVPAEVASGKKVEVRLAIPITIVRGKIIPQ